MFLWYLLFFLLLQVLIFYVVANFIAAKLIDIVLNRDNKLSKSFRQKKVSNRVLDLYPDVLTQEKMEINQGEEFWQRGQAVQVVSHDGLRLAGSVFNQSNESQDWVIALHGYRSTGKKDMAYVGHQYFNKGYNVLIPDLRGHGASEGKVIGMGWLDRLDLLTWINWLVTNFPKAKIVLHGGSMGAATVLMTSGEKLPSNVYALVSDSAFTSAYSECEHVLKDIMHFPSFPLMPAANHQSKKFAGYQLKEASATKQVASNHLPLLLIHGSADHFVPIDCALNLQEATVGPCEFLEIKEAGHLTGMTIEPQLYWQTVFDFLKRQNKNKSSKKS
ncbi:fermentation-respiration switch protein FrsA (DUF1100 family) [Enterococcus sp. PF1-24]|uniref:alpha/beta hydrolase n=1 Tax=unclassified Enterococcus TaxID=2608891 RepID=UPI002472F14C|nr:MULTISPECIES: alpha/beta hydrolase [unclassified Enterococcus]MDH6364622.1 fermentation-respiration switch protein FrsA (DUF1100 family) [Enterococcus sp. PFB1-1]MDH6401723.1 fermentation-respiration switch protein FrsA (DUF1100 family) [Enterococcus sp. PF1-24]